MKPTMLPTYGFICSKKLGYRKIADIDGLVRHDAA
jgi:hypothetical protein